VGKGKYMSWVYFVSQRAIYGRIEALRFDKL